jgi:hypothetical protein
MPEEWNIAILISLFKSEVTANFNYYRRTNFVCTVYKICAKIQQEELEE